MTTSAARTISVGPGFGELAGDVDADFGHRGDGGGVDLGAGFGAAGPGDGAVAGEVVEPAEGHLRAAGVVHAQEQHDRGAVGAFAFDFGEGAESLAGEAFGHQRQEVGELGAVGELVVAGLEEQLDGLGGEEVVELVVQGGGGELGWRSAGRWRGCRGQAWW